MQPPLIDPTSRTGGMRHYRSPSLLADSTKGRILAHENRHETEADFDGNAGKFNKMLEPIRQLDGNAKIRKLKWDA